MSIKVKKHMTKEKQFMNRKFEQRSSTIPPISTKTSNHLSPQTIKHQKQTPRHMAWEI
jgi:hypothetical protein